MHLKSICSLKWHENQSRRDARCAGISLVPLGSVSANGLCLMALCIFCSEEVGRSHDGVEVALWGIRALRWWLHLQGAASGNRGWRMGWPRSLEHVCWLLRGDCKGSPRGRQ